MGTGLEPHVAFVWGFSVSEWRLCFVDFGDSRQNARLLVLWASGQQQEPEGICSYSEPNGSCPGGDYVQAGCNGVVYMYMRKESIIDCHPYLHWTRIRCRIGTWQQYVYKKDLHWLRKEQKQIVLGL